MAGLDARLRFGANWFATLQAVASATREKVFTDHILRGHVNYQFTR